MTLKPDLRLRTTLLDFFKIRAWTNPHAVTLTLRQGTFVGGHWRRLTRLDAQQNLRHFRNVLDKQLLRHGLSKNAILFFLPIFEGRDNRTRPHNHLMLDVSASVDTQTLRSIIRHAWGRTDWGHKRITVDYCRNPQGWLEYITKLRSKENYADSIDWMNYSCSGLPAV